KPKAVQVNLDAIKVGLDHYQDNFSKQDAYRLEPMTGVVEGKVLVEGNQAAALGALMGGVTVAAWYPITPSSSLCEYLIAYADRFRIDPKTGEKRIAVVQAEFALSDLDLGMTLWMTPAFKYPEKPFDRGKVLSKEDLDHLSGEWGRYQHVEGDGITYRTLPGTDHPAAGYFTRGSGHDEHARYTESADAYARNMDRLNRKFETARAALPAPVVDESGKSSVGLIAFGSTDAAVREARE